MRRKMERRKRKSRFGCGGCGGVSNIVICAINVKERDEIKHERKNIWRRKRDYIEIIREKYIMVED
jgi:hypothetical protein